jgi:hypothetical protein
VALKADGFSPKEIRFMEAYLDKHPFDHTGEVVVLKNEPMWVCRTIAEALEHLRPGCWQREFSEELRQPMTAELHLPIFKQGDDLAHHLEQEQDTKKALLAYAGQLRAAAGMVEQVAEHADHLQIDADTHWISVSGPTLAVGSLIEQGVLTPNPCPDVDEADWAEE